MTPSPSPTAPPTCGPGVGCIEIESTAGAQDSHVRFSVRLRTNGLAIAGIQNDIHLEAAGAFVHCSVNREIEREGTRFAVTERSVRALVFSFEDYTPIADGVVLYTCEVAIAPRAAIGDHAIDCAGMIASNGRGTRQPVACRDGVLTVTAAASPTPSQSPPPIQSTPSPTGVTNADGSGLPAEVASSASGGCTLVEPSSARFSWFLLIGATALMQLRFAIRLTRARRL
jgi:hypothetical protein